MPEELHSPSRYIIVLYSLSDDNLPRSHLHLLGSALKFLRIGAWHSDILPLRLYCACRGAGPRLDFKIQTTWRFDWLRVAGSRDSTVVMLKDVFEILLQKDLSHFSSLMSAFPCSIGALPSDVVSGPYGIEDLGNWD